MTVGQLKEALGDSRLFDHTEVVIAVKDQTIDGQNPDDDEVETLTCSIQTSGKRTFVLHPVDSLVLMYPNRKVTHL